MKNQPLKQQIRLWSAILVIIPSLLIMAIYTMDRIVTAKQERLELISQRVEYGKLIIEDWVAERARDVRAISQFDAFRDLDRQQMESILELMQKENAEFDSLSFIDRDGFFQISTLAQGIRFKSVAGQPYFESALAGKEYISDVVVGRNSGLPIINFSSPIFNKNGQFQGLILGSVRTNTIERLVSKQWFGQTGEILLVNQNGTFIVKPRYINKLVDTGTAENTVQMGMQVTESAFRNINFGKDGTASWVDYLNNKVLGAYRYVPERGWSLVGKINEAEILTPVYEQLIIMAISVIALIILLLPMATLLTNRFKRPIDWLISQLSLVSAEQYALIGRDKYDGKLPHELSMLFDALSGMSRKVEHSVCLLKEKLSEIQDINKALENEITERQKVQRDLVELNQNLETEINIRTRKLKQNEQDYRTLVENSPDVITRYDRNYRIIFGNAACIDAAGKSLETIAGKVWPDSNKQEKEYSEWVKKMEHVFQTGVPVEFETKLLCANGYRCFAVRFIPEFNQHRQIETILSIARDITEQKQLEAEFSRFDRLNVVGEMAASIAHEVRNPMTTVRGYLQYYLHKDKFAEYREAFSVMIDEIDRSNSIITDFLSLAKDKTVDITRGNLSNLISSLFTLLQADALCRGHEIVLDLEAVPDSDFDSKEIRQLILNLVRNSFEAIDNCGRVIIRAYQKEKSIIVEVQDNGPGIPEKVMDKLGTPFVTTKDNGTGLGLPVCYRIVERHNAKMSVKTSSHGTIFTVEF